MTIGDTIHLRLVPYVAPFEEGRVYLCVFQRGDEKAYFAAFLGQGQWHEPLGTNLTEEGWQLMAHTGELPLLE